jgi:polysaccharide biosynthesis/export protein
MSRNLPPVSRSRPQTPRTKSRGWQRAISSALIICLPVLSSGCGSSGSFVWYHSLPRSDWERPQLYLIGVGDTISVRVYEQENISTKVKVRSDGRLEMPFVGEVEVVGKQPFAVAREIETRLKAYIVSPRVTVNVEDTQQVTVTVMGEVGSKGSLVLQPPAELAQALAQAGGLTEFASESKIFVLRRLPQFRRIRFTYEAIEQNQGGAAMFPLRTGDVVIVE